jgi:hypothetical protein
MIAECDVQSTVDEWQMSRVKVHKGDRLLIRAEGEWCINVNSRRIETYGPDGIRRDGSGERNSLFGLLMARVGARIYLVGREAEITAERDDELLFRSSDWNVGDNSGSVHVKVFVLPPRPQD